MAESNPFFHRGPVRDQAYFSSRSQEVAFMADLLRQGQSVAICGPRRFGKTSLLFPNGAKSQFTPASVQNGFLFQ